MNTDVIRKSVSFPKELELQISRRAKKYDRSFSAQVVADMRVVIDRARHTNVTVVSSPTHATKTSGKEVVGELGDTLEK